MEVDPRSNPKNDKGIGDFCTMIEHSTNRLAGKDIDTEEIAERLEACAEAVRTGRTVRPAKSHDELSEEKKVRKAKHSPGIKRRKKRRSVV